MSQRNTISLREWGLRPEFEQALAPGELIARVVEEQKTRYLVAAEEGILRGQLAGKLLRPSVDRLERPVVGDWVAIRPLQGESKAVILRVLPRASILRRKAAGETEAIQPLAANVDLTFIVTSLNREFNEKRLHRYLTVAQEAGTRTAVLLTKIDLAPESTSNARALSEKYGVPCVPVCALSGEGLANLGALWSCGETAVFVGSSGVGKSTLVNALLGRLEQETAAVRDDDDRGRHTTTSRRLLLLPNGALVIDTPGLREIQLDAGHAEGLEKSFAAITELARGCRFANCAHETEPGCAVKAALARGELEEEQYASYLKLRRDLGSSERNSAPRPPRIERKRK